MFQRLVNYLSKHSVAQGYGVTRMNNTIGQFKIIVDDLNKAASEIADQRAALDAEMNRLLDRVDDIEVQMDKASGDMSHALTVAKRINDLID